MEAARTRLEAARRAGLKEGAARTMAEGFALLLGLGLLAVGVLGFFFGDSSFGTGSHPSGDTFLFFEVNGWHNVLFIATGALLVLFSFRPASAALALVLVGALYAGVTVWGFIDGDDVVNLVAIDDAGNWLHLGISAASIVVGLASGALGLKGRREHRRLAYELEKGAAPAGPRPIGRDAPAEEPETAATERPARRWRPRLTSKR
jgi:Domain of unknown function (DUF4383)